jgi:hypothetical protein
VGIMSLKQPKYTVWDNSRFSKACAGRIRAGHPNNDNMENNQHEYELQSYYRTLMDV